MMFLFKTNCNTQCMVKDLRPGKMYGYPYMDVWSGSQEICSHFQAGNFPKDACFIEESCACFFQVGCKVGFKWFENMLSDLSDHKFNCQISI